MSTSITLNVNKQLHFHPPKVDFHLPKNLPKIALGKLNLKWWLFWAAIIEGGLLAIVYGILFMTPNTVIAVNSPVQHAYREISVGSDTGLFLQQLQGKNLHPVVVSTVSRSPITVSGRLIALGGDNFQVFEYPNSNDAKREAGLLFDKYGINSTSTDMSADIEEKIHLYVNNNLLFFYVGSNSEIIALISPNAEITNSPAFRSEADTNQYVSTVSKFGEYSE